MLQVDKNRTFVLSRFCGIFCLISLSHWVLAGGGAGNGMPDTSRFCYKQNEAPSIIQRMTEAQLNTLIGYLLELDSIPRDLLAEINIARERINIQKATENLNIALDVNSIALPACDHYPDWNDKDIYPTIENLFPKQDTAFTVILTGEKEGKYFHPFPGIVSSGFGWRDSAMHNGIDLELKKGDPVSAAFNGKVRFAKRHPSYGNFVLIRHYNGLETVYAHLSKIKVKPGDEVVAGQVIGLGGSTGRSTGNHLHFEVRFRYKAVNPKYLISFAEQKLLADTVLIKNTRSGLCAYVPGKEFHLVEKGDNVYEVAKHYGISLRTLCNLNGWRYYKRLKPGEMVRVAEAIVGTPH